MELRDTLQPVALQGKTFELDCVRIFALIFTLFGTLVWAGIQGILVGKTTSSYPQFLDGADERTSAARHLHTGSSFFRASFYQN